MAVIEEGKNLGDLLKFEIDKNYCRETVTVASGQNLKFGTVVGMKTATGEVKIVSIASQETDGSDEAVGILLEDVDATGGAKKSLIISIGAMVAYDCLVFPGGASDAQKKAIVKGLFQRAIRVIKTV
jgi:hypothetical protein